MQGELTMQETERAHSPARPAMRLLKEPTLHFFLIGLLFFVIHQQIVGDPRTIVVDPTLKTELARRFRDQFGRAPNSTELDNAFATWKVEEALYHEALRENLEQQDPTIRQALADRLRVRTALELPKREPTQAELEAWFDSHKNLYDAPRRYHYEYASFEKAGASAEAELESFEQALKAGKEPASLGQPIFGGKVTAAELREKLGAPAAERIPKLPVGEWQRIESEKGLWLLRVKQLSGGLPSFEELRPRLVADWMAATEKQELERATQAIVEQYRFEEQP